ncbi:MAG: UDP-N-acetylglucosamine 1-carboxyvinyltransferase [Oscillospiraceae bacterium]|nr:UDP-N-acetylglucosamine 1-carboxyvinyltransferase [Oscillospiraceae bacterium]
MEIWHIRGGRRLAGSCTVQGSKNASLPILAASILCPLRCELFHVPQLRDVDAALRILRHLGCLAEQRDGRVYIDSTQLSCCSIPHALMEEMRSSVIFMGALLARCGEARLSLPGGCQLGKRPIDLHLAALRKLGAQIEEDGGEIACHAYGLRGAEIVFPLPSVGATENAMLAACAAKGETVIRGAAREPEIVALQGFLRAAGAQVDGAGSGTITVTGFRPRRSAACRIMPDRIVGATLACAAAATGGDVLLRDTDPKHFSTVLYFLNQAGCDIISSTHSVRIRSGGKLRGIGALETAPYPGFPTDAQPVLMAALLKAEGRTAITENIFENRFRQVPELRRLGAQIDLDGRTALIRGVDRLRGTALSATDLRGGAAMILAGLAADGETVICDEGHVTRGYERFDACLRSLGADVCLEY